MRGVGLLLSVLVTLAGVVPIALVSLPLALHASLIGMPAICRC